MRSIMFALLLSVSFLIPRYVDAKDSNANYKAWGVTTCGNWVAVSKDPKYLDLINQWIDGFRTAINMTLVGKPDFFENTDRNSIILFVDKFCRDHPLLDPFSGMGMLLHELKVPVLK